MFDVRSQEYGKHVVIPDIHGENEVLMQALDHYVDDDEVGFVFLGDILDKRGTDSPEDNGVYNTLETIRLLGERAVLVIANHEWVAHAAMSARPHGYAQAAAEMWLGLGVNKTYQANTVEAYGIHDYSYETPQRFKAALEAAGHLAVLTSATPYFETEKFIAVHAGVVPDTDWDEQKEYLIDVTRDMNHGTYFDNPPQWFDMKLAVTTKPVRATDKVVVSGHAHFLMHAKNRHAAHEHTSPDRSIHDGKRIRLASQLNAPNRNDLFVWQDWNGDIVRINRGLL